MNSWDFRRYIQTKAKLATIYAPVSGYVTQQATEKVSNVKTAYCDTLLQVDDQCSCVY